MPVHMTMVNTLRRRRAVPPEDFYAYWRDVHVQIASRLPGIHDLWIHWLSYDEGELWPRVEGVEWFLPEELRFDGCPEPTFARADDVERFLRHMAPLMADERVIFEETIAYHSLGDGTKTLVDRVGDPPPSGDQGVLRVLVFLQQARSVGQEEFRAWLAGEYASALAAAEGVLKVRYHLLEPPAEAGVVLDAGTAAVSHDRRPEDRYQGALEIAVAGRVALARLGRSDAWGATVEGQRRALHAAHAFHVPRTYCMKRDGELTVTGLRGAAAAQLISRLGAVNQLEDDARHLVLTGRAIGDEAA